MKRDVRVFLDPADYEQNFTGEWKEGIVVVLDILRATSTIVTALANGVERVFPCKTVEEVFELKKKMPEAILAGERNSFKVEGFDRGNSPEEFLKNSKKDLIITTTNGTRALEAAKGAREILIGSFLNMSAAADYLLKKGDLPLSIFCAGTQDFEAEEDIIGAGALLKKMGVDHEVVGKYEEADKNLPKALAKTRNGKRLMECKLEKDIEWCCRENIYSIIPILKNGCISIS